MYTILLAPYKPVGLVLKCHVSFNEQNVHSRVFIRCILEETFYCVKRDTSHENKRQRYIQLVNIEIFSTYFKD